MEEAFVLKGCLGFLKILSLIKYPVIVIVRMLNATKPVDMVISLESKLDVKVSILDFNFVTNSMWRSYESFNITLEVILSIGFFNRILNVAQYLKEKNGNQFEDYRGEGQRLEVA